ncbi:MAG: hypothetical protein QOH51_1424 [Acidobacteriota bacterium]|jgi:hypothetical protein|nr:hypothetical protein [Acidobacteriota bacterium]
MARLLRDDCRVRGEIFKMMEETSEVMKKLFAGVCAFVLAALAAGCADNANTTVNANLANSNATANTSINVSNTTASSSTANDNSEIKTETVNGVTTETRTFKDPNSRVERVVVTTRNGKRTARVYYRDKTARELPDNKVEQALGMTADALVSAGGTVVDASKEVGSAVVDESKEVGGATVNGTKKVGKEVGNKAEDVGDATVNGAKKAGSATAKGAKKVGSAIKNAVTP